MREWKVKVTGIMYPAYLITDREGWEKRGVTEVAGRTLTFFSPLSLSPPCYPKTPVTAHRKLQQGNLCSFSMASVKIRLFLRSLSSLKQKQSLKQAAKSANVFLEYL